MCCFCQSSQKVKIFGGVTKICFKRCNKEEDFFLENLRKEMRVRILKNLKNDLVHKAKKPEY